MTPLRQELRDTGASMRANGEWAHFFACPHVFDVACIHASFLTHAFPWHVHDHYAIGMIETGTQTCSCRDLPVWQKLNVAAFTVSGIAATVPGVAGADYENGSGNIYLPMFRQPVLVCSGTAGQMRTVYDRMRSRDLRFAIFTEELFATGNLIANRAAVRACPSDELRIVGLAVRENKKFVDYMLKGLSLHQ